MSEQNVYITSIEEINIGGVQHFKQQIGQIAVIIGRNAAGKSSLLDGILSVFKGGHDAELLRKEDLDGDGILESPCKEGKIILTLSDGAIVTKTITPLDSTLHVLPVDGRKVGAPKTYVEELAKGLAFDPMGFIDRLQHDPRGATKFLLDSLPLSFTAEEVNEAFGEEVAPIGKPVSLKTYDELRAGREGSRAAIKSLARDLEGAIRMLEGSLPSDDSTDWAGERDRLQRELTELEADIERRKSVIQRRTYEGRAAANEHFTKEIGKRKARIAEYCGAATNAAAAIERLATASDPVASVLHDSVRGWVAALQDALQPFLTDVPAIAALRQEQTDVLKGINDKEKSELEADLTDSNDKRVALTAELSTAKAKADEGLRARGIRETITAKRIEHNAELSKELELDAILKATDQLKSKKLMGLEIPGLDIAFDRTGRPVVKIGGLELFSLNRQRILFVAFQMVKKASTGQMPIIISEVAEIDPDRLIELMEAAEEAGLQLILARWERNEPLRIMSAAQYREKYAA